MRMLCDSYPTGVYPTGGLPWFAVPFGRDALFTSMFALPLNPNIARGALRFLAEHQGHKEDADTEEQPGKILHEVRRGEVVESGVWPHILYGTVDATPLFLCGLAEMHDWTGDDALLVELRPAAELALAWCFQYGDSDQDGWIDYMGAPRDEPGLEGLRRLADAHRRLEARHRPPRCARCRPTSIAAWPAWRGCGQTSRGKPRRSSASSTMTSGWGGRSSWPRRWTALIARWRRSPRIRATACGRASSPAAGRERWPRG